MQWRSKGKFTGEIEMRGSLLLGKFFEDTPYPLAWDAPLDLMFPTRMETLKQW